MILRKGTAMSKTPVELLEIALKKEKAAYSFYERMMLQTQVEAVIKLAAQLREEEAKHVQMITKKMAALRLGR